VGPGCVPGLTWLVGGSACACLWASVKEEARWEGCCCLFPRPSRSVTGGGQRDATLESLALFAQVEPS